MREVIKSRILDSCTIPEPPMHLLMFIMASVGVPMLLANGFLQENDWLPAEAERFKQLMRDPHAAQLRLQWALRGISTLGSGHYD